MSDKAFLVSCSAFDPPIEGITWALSVGEARYTAVRAAWSVGYDVTFKDFTVKRAREYDNHRLKKPKLLLSLEVLAEDEHDAA